MLQGTTAWHLLRTSAALREGESVVVHAAAGGVGTLAVQLAKRFGAGRVIGVASSDDKRALAERLGADATVDSGADDLTAALREANGGERVDVVLEMVGGRTFEQSFEALAPFGRLVHFGQADRQGAPEINPGKLMATSRGVIGFWLMHLVRQPERLTEAMEDMFAAVEAGELEPIVGGTYALEDARARARGHPRPPDDGQAGPHALVPRAVGDDPDAVARRVLGLALLGAGRRRSRTSAGRARRVGEGARRRRPTCWRRRGGGSRPPT